MNTVHVGHSDRNPGIDPRAERQAHLAFVFFAATCALALVVFALIPFIG